MLLFLSAVGLAVLFTVTGFLYNSKNKNIDINIDGQAAETDAKDTQKVSNPNSEEEQWMNKSPEYNKISPEEAYQMMQNPNSSVDTIIIDARTQEEFNEGHIADAVLVPYDKIKNTIEEIVLDKKAIILVYCRSGRRSALAAKDLVGLGYNHVYDFGGMIDWKYDIVK